MEKKIYETPQVLSLGSVRELTELVVRPPTECSALESDFGTEDGICEIP
ncbi:MAG TPA: lasso RiPP family leader peptide-containing protein [Gemmatimonadota bacterium]|nr:lasso RiPP family leader peptide-containing protein [Gemmatimonadota bacterium]